MDFNGGHRKVLTAIEWTSMAVIRKKLDRH
jgi:hypothetical protein